MKVKVTGKRIIPQHCNATMALVYAQGQGTGIKRIGLRYCFKCGEIANSE